MQFEIQQKHPFGPTQKYIIQLLAERHDRGIETYGQGVDIGHPPTGCWKLEVIEELMDVIQYLVRHIKDLEKEG